MLSTIRTQTTTQAAAGGSAATPTPTRPWRRRKDPAAVFRSAGGATTARPMKCGSVACLWPAAPPLHRVTSAAVSPGSRSFYTGGSDGSIVRWDLGSGDDVGPGEVVPLALLCGHAAPVVGFAICSSPTPAAASGLVSPDVPSLLSACADGVLCVWSTASGRCRRRRKLPPWAGTPVFVSPLPLAPRQACIFCSCSDAPGHHHPSESHKSAIVIVDAWSLNVLQTVFHGSLTIGPVKAMSIVPVVDERGRMPQNVILVDGHGRVQIFTVVESDNQGETFPSRSPTVDIPRSVSGEGFNQAAQAVAISGDGKLLALVFGTCCVFRSPFGGGITIGKISLDGSCICNESPQKSQISGVMFLEGISDTKLNSSMDSLVKTVVIWNSGGNAVVYRISNSDNAFKFEPWCEVTAFPIVHQLERSVQFCQLNSSLVQIQSICFRTADSLLWKPYIMTWSDLELGSAMDEKSGIPSLNLVGEGGFPGDSFKSLCTLDKNETEEGLNSSLSPSLMLGNKDNCNNGFSQAKRTVSSSMVLSEDFFAPYAVVYGFYTGEIEVLQLTNVYSEKTSNVGRENHLVYPQASELFFLGHTGAVLCLATHRMVAESGEHSLKRALISGSMDCTVRIWDFDTGSLISVLHHHISPVRQIILPPPGTYRPWYNCFLSVGDDNCVALVSLETLRVERMFPGHPIYPSMVAWDSSKGYVACLGRNLPSLSSDNVSVLYLWDVKSGARERIIRGAASHSMFDHFCRGINKNSISGSILGGTTSASSLLPVFKDTAFSESTTKGVSLMSPASRSHKSMETLDSPNSQGKDIRGKTPHIDAHSTSYDAAGRQTKSHSDFEKKKHPVKCSCPFPGIAALKFDLSCLMSPFSIQSRDKYGIFHVSQHDNAELSFLQGVSASDIEEVENLSIKESLERSLVRFSLCLLHLWDVDNELDKLLMDEMNVQKPEGCHITSGLLGDRGTLTLMFPGLHATLELWKSSSEFCAMRSLAMVSLAQRMISISHTCTTASSSLAAFYTRNFADKFQDIKHPSLQLLVSFWQDPSEHIRMAARSLFHCAAPRAVPYPLFGPKAGTPRGLSSPSGVMGENDFAYTGNGLLSRSEDAERLTQRLVAAESETSNIITWLESYEFQEWILWTKGTNQDATASNIIVAAALVVWYPSLVKSALPNLVVNHLIKLVMSMNDRYSSTAAELLAEGMESTWKDCLGPELPYLLGDIFFQIECLSVTTTNKGTKNQAMATTIREALVEILLPSIAMADIMVFLNHIEGQIWATSSDSPVHLVSLKTLIRVARGAPKALAPYLDKAIHFILQTMDPSNLVMRKACLNSCMIALKEIARVFPMIALNETLTRLAVGDAIGETKTAIIRVYDIESVTKIKILDASAPPGLPVLLQRSYNPRITTPITALTFSPDGEGLVAFSENGLMIRWWSLGSAWWEKLSRSLVPVPCTKLIFVPPWEGFSPNSSRTSIMALNAGHDKCISSQDKSELDEVDLLKLLIHNLDLSYRLQWVDGRKVKLVRHGQELGIFQL